MKNVLIINADIDKSPITRALMNAYIRGARESGATIRELAIADVIFNPNKTFGLKESVPEPGLQIAIKTIADAAHIAIFCPVYKMSINTKIKGFFDRIFIPDQIFDTKNNFSGKTARIISILDSKAWEDWQENQKPTYLPVKKIMLEKRQIRPVHTSTIGHLYDLENNYSKKWLQKLFNFGFKQI
ncbi:putative NADPH-quinone reductase [Pedobacter sp. UYP30]|uniref:NAD(P)H-dependent oxidoreductase n=1 Tax=Pedobacter sp. UYP30 TaxID=1756400 RepID=UPI0033919371